MTENAGRETNGRNCRHDIAVDPFLTNFYSTFKNVSAVFLFVFNVLLEKNCLHLVCCACCNILLWSYSMCHFVFMSCV